MTCFFPPDCYCTRLPWFMLQARNAPGVALRTVLQLANRIISYVQDIRKSFLLFLYFRSSPILLVVVGYRNLWLIQSLKGSFGATITLSERCLWSTLGAGHVQLCLSFLKPKYSQRHHLHRVMRPICTFFFLWVRGKRLRGEELKGRLETDMVKRMEMNKGLSILRAEPLHASLECVGFSCKAFLPHQNGGNVDKCNGEKHIYNC